MNKKMNIDGGIKMNPPRSSPAIISFHLKRELTQRESCQQIHGIDKLSFLFHRFLLIFKDSFTITGLITPLSFEPMRAKFLGHLLCRAYSQTPILNAFLTRQNRKIGSIRLEASVNEAHGRRTSETTAFLEKRRVVSSVGSVSGCHVAR